MTLILPVLLLLLPIVTYSQQSSDILIVGGGTSGCVLAAKLCSALPNLQITLLERGLPRSPQSDFLVKAPRNLFAVLGDRSVGEAITSLPDAAIGNRPTVALTGATLGGSTAINGMQWTVPQPGSVESWGINGLTTSVADGYYRRVYQKIGFGPPQSPLQYADEYVNAGISAGFALNTDPFNPSPLKSIWPTRLSVDKQFRRVDSCTAYLTPVENTACAQNVKLVQGVTASKILFKTENDPATSKPILRATGVQTVPSPGSTQPSTVYTASKEVLITAGPYNSPKLLQLSGIGTKSTLSAAGVTQVLDLPVGEATVCRASATIPSTYTGVPDEPANNQALVNSPQSRAQWEAGNGGLLGTPVSAANGLSGLNAYFGCTLVPFTPGPPEIRSACYHNTETKGFLRIRDGNVFSEPLVKNNFLQSPADVQRLTNCVKEMADIHRNFPPEFQMTFMYPPGGVVTEGYVKSVAQWGAHFVGGCPVGDVLTGDLKVKGTVGLRVIDASAIRNMPVSAGPVSSVYMIAELMSERLIPLYK